jgi:putative ABC transport system permease protein
MFKNYIKIAWRNLIKNKLYSIINIVGLSVGVACSLIIFLFVNNELSYDRFHKDSDNIYRALMNGKLGENEFHFSVAPAPLASAMMEEIPVVEIAVRFRNSGSYIVKKPGVNESFKESRIIAVDSGFFDLFSFPLLEGDPEKQFKTPNSMAISQKMADKYFPGKSAINQMLLLNGDQPFNITGVFADMPKNSHIQMDFLISMSHLKNEANNMLWVSNNFYTYFRLQKDADPEVVSGKINEMISKYLAPQIMQFMGKTLEELDASGSYYYAEIQPLEAVYLNSDFTFDIGRMGNKTYVYLFALIAIFITVLACINFMNLSTARSGNRSKEVGVRKVLGSFRKHLILQFLMESIMLTIFSFVIGILIASLLLPFFNDLAGKELSLPLSNPLFLLVLMGSSLVIGIMAGVYPAFYLSSFKPIETLKGKLTFGHGNSYIRSGLVVFQFFISIILVMGTITIYKQLNYIQNKQVGFQREQVILVQDAYMLGDQRQSFKETVNKLPNVSSASFSGYLPVSGYNRSDNTFWPEGKSPSDDNLVLTQIWQVDYDYITTMGMKLTKGRDFNIEQASDSNAIVVNETAFKKFGFTDMEGQNWIQTNANDENTGQAFSDQFNKFRVIGVVKDFNYESLKSSIGALAFQIAPNTSVLSIKLNSSDFESSLAAIEDTWKSIDATLPFSYSFLDDEFGAMYASELKMGKIFTIFTSLAVFIGCLGLFALASFMAEQRTKEIGIRKLLGASVNGIVLLLSKQFSKLVIIAFILAVPLAWWGITTWLEGYTYRISIGWELFALSGVAAFLIAWITVAYHSIKVALSNPAKVLKSE